MRSTSTSKFEEESNSEDQGDLDSVTGITVVFYLLIRVFFFIFGSNRLFISSASHCMLIVSYFRLSTSE